MAAVGVALSDALGGLITAVFFFGVIISLDITFLICTNKMTLKDLKDFIKDLKR